jgi:hypothetical protein
MVKKILIAVVVLVVVVAGGLFYLYSNLGSIIKTAIETYGSQATQAKVTVDSVKLSATDGQGSISGLVVGNPPGFNGPQSISLGLVSLTVDTSSIMQNPVIIKQVVIDAPQVSYERSLSGGGNLEKIRENVTSYANAQRGQPSGGSQPSTPSGGSQPSAPSAGSSPAPADGEKKVERKVIINDLSVRNGKVSVSATQLQGRTLSANLPAIQLRDIGKDKGGATPAEVAQAVLGAITNEASKVAVAELQKSLGNIGGAVQERLQNVNPGGAADQLRGILGGGNK